MSPRTFCLIVLSQSDLHVISSSFTLVRQLVGSSSLLTFSSTLSKTVQIVFDWLNVFDEVRLIENIQIHIFSWNLFTLKKKIQTQKNTAKNVSCNILIYAIFGDIDPLISAIFSDIDESIENIILNNDVAQEFLLNKLKKNIWFV